MQNSLPFGHKPIKTDAKEALNFLFALSERQKRKEKMLQTDFPVGLSKSRLMQKKHSSILPEKQKDKKKKKKKKNDSNYL
jgi:hypothetical protein